MLPPDEADAAKRYIDFVYGGVSERYATALGRVTAQWGRVEDQLGFLISNLLGHGESLAGMAMVAELSAAQRAVTVATLIDCAAVQDWSDRWDGIQNEFNALRTRRNAVVHAAWMSAARGAYSAWRVRARGRVVIESSPVPVPELQALSDEIAGLLERVVAFLFLLDDQKAAERIIQISDPQQRDRIRAPKPSARAQALEEARRSKKARREADRAASSKPPHDPETH